MLAAIEAHGLTPANVNGAGQIVAAGTMAQLAAFAADPPAGARLRPLSVAGAFHTLHMAPAVEALAAAAAQVQASDPVPAPAVQPRRRGRGVRQPTGWTGSSTRSARRSGGTAACRPWPTLGVTALIELPPAGTLTGLGRRALPGIQLVALKTPDDLPAARAPAGRARRRPRRRRTRCAGRTPARRRRVTAAPFVSE